MNAPRKVGFTGTQTGMTREQAELVTHLLADKPEVHHGDCIGADAQCHNIARHLGCRIIIHPPYGLGKRAFCEGADAILPQAEYLERNHTIVDATNLLMAAPHEFTEKLRSGTWATIRYARKQKKPILIINPDGTIIREDFISGKLGEQQELQSEATPLPERNRLDEPGSL